MDLARRLPLHIDSKKRRTLTLRVPTDALTESITVTLRRPTTALPLAWDKTTQLQVRLALEVDSEPYQCIGRISGGVRKNREGKELSEYRLTYHVPILRHNGVLKRIGALGSTHVASVDIEVLQGSVETEVLIAEVTSRFLPDEPYHNSVAFDAASSVLESGGDGVISFSHTASGGNRAAFIGMASEVTSGNAGTHSATYAGNAATSIWSTLGPFTSQRYSGLRLLEASIPTGSQTVTATVAAGVDTPGEFGAGIITMTGVHQTVPVGTEATQSATTGTNPSVTVGSVGVDDLIVDVIFGFNASGGMTAGAGQVDRWAKQNGTVCFSGSTQLGTDGGVMSWTRSNTTEYMMGAVAFKPSTAVAAPAVLVFTKKPQRMMRGLGR